MILKDYEKLPEKMKNEKVKEYYDNQFSLVHD